MTSSKSITAWQISTLLWTESTSATPLSRNELALTVFRKRAVSSQTSELEALEARLKATEERLKQKQAMSYANRGSQSPRQRAPLGDTFSSAAEEPQRSQNQTSPLATEFRSRTPIRPQTGKKEPSNTTSAGAPPMPGALPPTPGASEGESASSDGDGDEVGDRVSADYVVVAKDGEVPLPMPPTQCTHRPAS